MSRTKTKMVKPTAKAKGQKVQTAKLELPEGYKKPDSDEMGGRKGKMHKIIAAAERDHERVKAGLKPLQLAPVDKAANARLEAYAEELGVNVNIDPKIKRLYFNEARKWRSLENPKEFMKTYKVFQDHKLQPKVFPDESAPGRDQEQLDYIKWYQINRLHYFQTQNRTNDLQVLEKVKNWPNIPNAMTSAPFMRMPLSEHKFVENRDNLKRGLCKLLNEKDIAQIILDELAKDGYIPLSNLSQTCHSALNLVSQFTEHWNETPPGDFLGDDVSVAEEGVKGTPVTLMISPIRKPFNERTDMTFAEHYKTQTRLYRALKNRCDTITNLQLHRVQFLDHNAVRCILGSLQNLKFIGIYQCQLLHLGNMDKLLYAVKVNARRKDYHYSFVDLDFSPMYHDGPNSILRHGSYGSVWNHPGCDMATGIWQIVLYELYPMARNMNIDILKWGCAFRSFLERLPMPEWANVRIYEAIKSFEYTGRENTSELDMTAYNPREGKWERFIDDVTAALRTDGLEPAMVPSQHLHIILKNYQPKRQRSYGWWRALKSCARCRKRVPAIFCPFGEGRCWGCLTKVCLKADWDHFKTFKANAAAEWFGRYQNLDDVTKAGAADEGFMRAQRIDKFRQLENKNNHGTGEKDWPTHADFGSLHRRYARTHEPHGPLDRKLNDRQYMPLGSFETGITSNMVPSCYPQYSIQEFVRAWETWREHKHPGEPESTRAPLRQEYLEKCKVVAEKDGHRIIADQNNKDASIVEDARQHYEHRLMWPNRQVKCWDELIQDMLTRQDIYLPNGKLMKIPALLQKKRPNGFVSGGPS